MVAEAGRPWPRADPAGLRQDELQDRLYHQIGGTTAVQTLVFDSRRGADDPAVLRVVAAADAIFIAGGDQSRYIRFWKGTALNRALNAHVRAGKPIAGTSAGLAILGAMPTARWTAAASPPPAPWPTRWAAR